MLGKLWKGKKEDIGISSPYNVSHDTHVTPDYNWEVSDPEKVFALECLIGKGFGFYIFLVSELLVLSSRQSLKIPILLLQPNESSIQNKIQQRKLR